MVWLPISVIVGFVFPTVMPTMATLARCVGVDLLGSSSLATASAAGIFAGIFKAHTRSAPTPVSHPLAPENPLPDSAFEALVRAHYGRLCNVARRFGKSRDAAEDVVQEVFTQSAPKRPNEANI